MTRSTKPSANVTDAVRDASGTDEADIQADTDMHAEMVADATDEDTEDNTDTTDEPDFGPFTADVIAYCAARGDTGAMAKVRTKVRNASCEAVRARDIQRAFDAQAALDAMTTRTDIDRKPVDYPQLAANYAATLRMAADMVETGEADNRPEGVDPYVTDDADLPDGTVDADMAHKLANRNLGRPRGDVTAHIVAATSGTSGFRKVSQIANYKSDVYGDRNVSPGAVGAALSKMHDGDRYVPSGLHVRKDANGRLGAEWVGSTDSDDESDSSDEGDSA